MRTLIAAVVAALAVPPAPGRATQADLDSRLARFQLFNDCRPVSLFVAPLSAAAADIGLTEEQIQATTELGLRSARIYDESAGVPYLSVRVMVSSSGRAVSIDFRFMKMLDDPLTANRFPAVTWSAGATGTHGGDAGYVLDGVSDYADRFVLEYLRVNDDAC